MASSIEKHAREKADTSEAIQSELRNLASRVEASGQREALSDTKAPYADAREEEAAPPFLHSNSNIPIFDLPPFPEKPPLAPTMPPPYDLRAAPDDHGKSTAAADSFLAAARRFARAGNSSAQQRNAAFSWVDAGSPQQAKDNSHTRLVLLGGIGLLVLAAVGAGLYLSNSFSRTTTIPQTAVVGPRSGHVGATPTVTRIQPAQSIPHLISIAAPAVKATRSAVAPKPVPFHLAAESSAPAPAARQVDAQSATAQSAAKPGMPQARLAALAKAGNAKAEEVLGLEYLDGDGVVVNEAEGAKWLERAAARGEAVAAYRLGTLYERGHGVTADHVRAARWYMAAANAGNRKAMHNLAVAYAQGSGVRKDLALAAQWFLRAANAGMADSQFNLAVLFERGMGVQQSLTQAYKWYAIAAAQGDPECKVRMEAIAPQLNAADKAAAEKAAADFQPAAVDRAANSPPIAASLVGG
jgi:localization factor PodJL